jgi:pimeloyl-ACP methyl ester carboxylesterase
METYHTITIAGHQLGFTVGNEQGRGPAVVFLHGILGSERFWPPLLPERIRRNARWYAVSLPGHFPSRFSPGGRACDLSADCLSGLLHGLIRRVVSAEPVGLVGWSTGGCLALCLAARWPEQVRSVLSIAGFADGRWHGALGLLQKLARSNSLGQRVFRQVLRTMTASDWLYRRAYSLAAAHARPLMTSATARVVLTALRADAARQDRESLRLLLASIRDWNVAERLGTIRVPVVIAGGDRDPIIPYSHTLELARLIPGARLVAFPGMGHTFFGEHLPEFHASLVTWFDEILTQAAA